MRRKLLSRSATVGIVGQGYVGLSLAAAAASSGFRVIGVDVDGERVEALSADQLVVSGVREDDFLAGVGSNRLSFTTDHDSLLDADVIIVCVPTPVRDQTPDLSYVEVACKEVALRLQPGRLVLLESTTYPGTTEQLVKPLLESNGLSASRDFLLAYSPERIDPGNKEFDFRSIPRIVGGMTKEATGAAALFYQQLVNEVFIASSCRAAELAKLLENTYRHVNIALANEMAILCHEMDIDVWEVIEAAASKPFGFSAFYPGPGVGGHCIPLDPAYLAWQVRRDVGHQFRVLEQAQDVNARMPAYVADRIGETLNQLGKAVKNARVFVLGITYKPDIGDVRESAALKVMEILARRGAKIQFHDPFVEKVEVGGSPLARSPLTQSTLARVDCVALLNAHQSYDLEWIAAESKLIFDSRNAYRGASPKSVVRL